MTICFIQAVEAYSDSANASTQTSQEMAALANYFSSSAITASSISNTAMGAPGFMMRAAQTDKAAGGFAGQYTLQIFIIVSGNLFFYSFRAVFLHFERAHI